MQRGHAVFLIAMLFYSSFVSAQTDRISAASGNWATAGTWFPSGIPAAGDNITIAAGHTVIMNGSAGNCLSLTVNGFADWTGTRITNVGAGGLILNGSGQLNNSTSTGTLNVAGNFTVSAGAAASINRLTISVTGSTSILGSLTFGDINGTKTFTGDITINNGGTWNSTVAESFIFNGSLINNGTFTANTGTYTLGGTAKTLSGTSSIIFVNAAINGSYTNNGTVQINTNMSGSGTLTQGAGSTLIIGDTTPANILTASATGNTVRYLVSASMSTLDITYYNLIIEELGGTVNGNGTYTVSGDYSVVSGTASLTSVTIGGNVTVDSGSTLNIGAGPFSVSGTTAITGTVTVTSATSTKTFQDVVINSGGVWNNTAAETFTINGNVTMSGGTLASTATTATGIYNIAGTLNITSGTTNSIGRSTLNITGTTTIDGTLQITNATGTKAFNDLTVSSTGTWNSIVSSGFTINGNLSNSGTFNANSGTYRLAGASKLISGTLSVPTFTVTGSYTNNGTVSSTTALRGAGTFSQGTTGTLNVSTTNANFSITTFNASASGNTVNYNSTAAQNVRIPSDGSYHHLTLSNSGAKTLVGTTDINGNLTISSGLTANNFNVTLGGNWSSTGSIFIPGTNTVTLDGAAQSIGRTGGETFNHLAVSGTGIKTLTSDITTNGNLTINSTLDVSASNFAIDVNGNWTNNGTFTQGSGTVTFSSPTAAQTIGGTTATNFNNIIQSNSSGVSLTQHQNLIDALTISSGTFTTTGFNFTLRSTSSGTARIATIPSGANFAGNIIMERYTGTGPTDWRFLCSSVSGATLADWADDFATSGFPGSTDPSNPFVSIWSYDETQPGNMNMFGFVPAANVTDPIVFGTGYWVYLGPTPVTFEVTGPPNTFSQSLPVTYTNSGDISNDGWNLIANPFPSAIDWDDANWTKTNIENGLYIFNSYTGSWASHTGAGDVGGGSRYIASSQAFWVKADGFGVPALAAVELVKTASENPYPSGPFLKVVKTPNTSHCPMAFQDFPIPLNSNNIPNSILLTASGNGYDDETFIRFMQGATNNFDASFDAWKLTNINPLVPNISSVINDSMDLAINCYPELNSDITIPIRVTVSVTGTYSIRRDSILMLPVSSCVFLEDLLNGNMTDLRTTVSYSFTIADTTAAPRFLLHIYAPISKQAVHAQCAGDSSGMAVATGTGTGPWNYVWTNSNGDTLQVTPNSNTSDSLFNLPAGVYTVEVSGSVCGTVTDTIVINSTAIAVTVNYADVSCYGMNDGSAAVSVAGGSPPYSYLWSNGATTSQISNLSSQIYSVAVTDAGGCSHTQTFSISQPAQIISGFTSSTDTVDISFNNSASFTNTSSGATSYYWYFGDSSAIDTAQNPIHYYSFSGTYTAMLIAFNGSCSDTSYKIIEVINSQNSGIAQTTANSAYVNVLYENGEVFLGFNLPEKHDVSISVYNTLGERIASQFERNIFKGRVKLRVENLSSGVYVSAVEMKPIGNSNSGLNDLATAKKIIIFGK